PDRLDRGRAAGGERGTGFPPRGPYPPKDARGVAPALWPDTGENRPDRRPEPRDRPAVRRGLPRRRTGRAATLGRPGSGQRPRRSYHRHPRDPHQPTRADGCRSRRADRTQDGADAEADTGPEVPEGGARVPLAVRPRGAVPTPEGLARPHP